MKSKPLLLVLLCSYSFSFSQVAPMLKTKWNQTCGYNTLLPPSNDPKECNRDVVGCSGVALAQITKYWQYPSKGSGTISYTQTNASAQTVVNFDTVAFNWQNIGDTLNQVGKNNFDLQHLLFNCAYVTRSNFGAQGTSGSFSPVYLVKNLGYSINAKTIYPPFPTNLDSVSNIIKRELNNKRPVELDISRKSDGAGHGVVIDGYQSTSPIQFHINWGWGGADNGFFPLNKLISVYGGGEYVPLSLHYDIKPKSIDVIETNTDTLFFNSFANNTSIVAQYLFFTSNIGWQVTLNDTWLYLYKSSTKGTGTNPYDSVTVYPSANKNPNNRIGTITLSNSKITKTVVIVQNGTNVTGLDGISHYAENDMVVYPNPAKEMLFVKSMTVTNKESEFRIYNSAGETVLIVPVTDFETSISLKGLNSGIYYIQGNGKAKKFVIE